MVILGYESGVRAANSVLRLRRQKGLRQIQNTGIFNGLFNFKVLFLQGLKMILTQILEPACIIVPLQGKNKEAVITELVDVLNAGGSIQDRNGVLRAVLAREQTRSTGIGSGIAIPHGKCKGVKELVMAMGIAPQGIDFESIDEKPVYIVVMLASPLDKTGPHIQALARISRLMLDENFKNKIQKSTSAQELYDLISSKESE